MSPEADPPTREGARRRQQTMGYLSMEEAEGAVNLSASPHVSASSGGETSEPIVYGGAVRERLQRVAGLIRRAEEGIAVGWLLLGILIGVGLVIFAIIKFLIPGE